MGLRTLPSAFLLLQLFNSLSSASLSPTIVKGHKQIGDGLTVEFNNELNFPRFAEPILNQTVTLGRDALLSCVVENLKGYKLAWVRVDTQTILSIHHEVITQNKRISLSYNDHRSWYLHIRQVEESDRGWYLCQVNTDPMRSRKGYLQVVVPPSIVEQETSSDMVVREGSNVTLKCSAKGYPEPYLMWRREDGKEMFIGGENVNAVDGQWLQISRVSRLHMTAYLCVASNGVPPSISKRVQLRVQFPPMLTIPNQLEGAYLGQSVTLECQTEAHPVAIHFWTTDRGDIILSGDKYETTSTSQGYMKKMRLTIHRVGPKDFGSYRCVAKNSLGESDGQIVLEELQSPTTTESPEYRGEKKRGSGEGREFRDKDRKMNKVFKGGPGAVSSNAVLNKSKSNHQMSMHLFLPAVFITCFLQATYECHYNQQQRVGSR